MGGPSVTLPELLDGWPQRAARRRRGLKRTAPGYPEFGPYIAKGNLGFGFWPDFGFTGFAGVVSQQSRNPDIPESKNRSNLDYFLYRAIFPAAALEGP